MSVAATTPAGAAQLGRTRITIKALNRVASAVTAEALGVDADHVDVDFADREGTLALTVNTPIRVVSLARVEAEKSVVQRTGGSIVDRITQAQETIRDQVSALTGSRIGHVTVRITGVNIRSEGRVK